MLENVGKCWMLRILPKMLKRWKMLVQKLMLSTQIILFFDKEFKKLIINPYFYQHLLSALLINNRFKIKQSRRNIKCSDNFIKI